MATLSMRFDTRQAQQAIRQLRTRAPHAIARALNRAGVTARAALTTAVSQDMGLRAGVVKDRMGLREATDGRPVVQVTADQKRIPLINWSATGPMPSRGTGPGVTVRLPGGQGRYPHAFLAQMRSGHRGVFKRKATRRLPIRELHGPSIAKVAAKHAPQALERGQESLVKNLQSELRFAARQTV